MKYIIVILLLAVSLLASDYDDGLQAYENGDYQEAIKLWDQSANDGDSNSQEKLGELYYNGLGVPQDYKEAARLYTLSANQGNDVAQILLALMYESGQGVSQNYEEAQRLLTLSASQGNAVAQYNLGLLYENMKSQTDTLPLAYALYNSSASHGYKQAIVRREIIVKRMSPKQIETAHQLHVKMQTVKLSNVIHEHLSSTKKHESKTKEKSN